MPDFGCCCGNGFHVTKKECSLLIPVVDQFCSADCFLYFISLQAKFKNGSQPNAKSPFVSDVFDVWDDITNRYYRSWYEVYVARCLWFNEINFEYETRFIFVKNRPYTPDFWLPEYRSFIEVKGFWGMSSKKKFKMALSVEDRLFLLPWHLYSSFKSRYKLKKELFSVVR